MCYHSDLCERAASRFHEFGPWWLFLLDTLPLAMDSSHRSRHDSPDPNSLQVAAMVADLFQQRGDSRYGGEAVTQLEHALQAAVFAERAGADDYLVTAALLHDVGHLLHDLPADAPDHLIDDRHETLAAKWLWQFFDNRVVEPVRLHVAAKRYLCLVDEDYLRRLSPPSVQSLQLQGGPMREAERIEFELHPYFQSALELRRWDEAAKIAGMETPGLDHFLHRVRNTVRRDGRTHR
jgi:phosphonate degradation associated HDIG domain protein